jgi:hypothetical protein
MADTPATERSFYNLPCQMSSSSSSSSLRAIGTYNGSYTSLRCIATYIPQCAHQRTGLYTHTHTRMHASTTDASTEVREVIGYHSSIPPLFSSLVVTSLLISFRSVVSLLQRPYYALFSHASPTRLLSSSTVCCVLRPASFSSRLILVAAAASPIEIANSGSRALWGRC